MSNSRPVWAEIDLDALKYNFERIKEKVNNKNIIVAVKADAYGHGAIEVSKALIEYGASKLAVAMISEALELRKNNIDAPIMILGYTPLDNAEELINNNIEQTIYNYEYVEALSKVAIKLGKKVKIHIAIDTGMGRIGFLPTDDTVNIIEKISKLEGIIVEGIFTHYSTSDEDDKEYTYEQFSKFLDIDNRLKARGINIPLKHTSNSGAIIDLPETYLDGVRPGIILYGYYPSQDVKKENLSLKPVLTLKAQISHVKELDKDMYISYGRKFKTDRKSVIATIPIGYADGYTRLLSGKAKVIINGKFAKVVGNICMDQCMIDVTGIEDVKVGDEVILLGEQGDAKYNADDIAEDIGTINYEILCMIKKRIPRVYISNGKIIKEKSYI